MKNLITIALLTLILISCKSIGKENGVTYFGGQIVNPKSNFVTLMKGDKSIDTIYLNKDDTFLKELNYIKEGLYYFRHGSINQGYEFQYIYFKPKDSIVIRLNTWDFDESLVFSGKGAEKNNFLITLYLQNEKNNKSFDPLYNLNPVEFLNKTATIESINLHLYDQLKESGVELTTKFDQLAKVAVSYPIYLRKEIYPYRHKKRFQLDSLPSLPENYYDYRNEIDINNKNLIDYYPFNNYVNNYLYNLAYKECDGKENFTENLLKIIVEKIKTPELKNRLLYQAIYNDFRSSKYSSYIDKVGLEIFNKHCTNKEFLDKVQRLSDDCKNSKDQNSIKNFELITTKSNRKTTLKSIIKNKKSVIYFWSPNIMSSEMLIERISRLKRKHPSIQFIGINMQPSENEARIYKFLDNQYFLPQESKGNELIKSNEPRTILINDKGIVTNSFTYISSPYFEKQLLDLDK